MRGLCVAFQNIRRRPRKKFAAIQPPASFFRTSSLTALPSTVFPARAAITAFITRPMSLALTRRSR